MYTGYLHTSDMLAVNVIFILCILLFHNKSQLGARQDIFAHEQASSVLYVSTLIIKNTLSSGQCMPTSTSKGDYINFILLHVWCQYYSINNHLSSETNALVWINGASIRR